MEERKMDFHTFLFLSKDVWTELVHQSPVVVKISRSGEALLLAEPSPNKLLSHCQKANEWICSVIAES